MSIYKKIYLVVFIFTVFGLTLSTVLNIRTSRNLLYENAEHQARTLLHSLQDKSKYAITVINPTTGNAFVDRATLDRFVQDMHSYEDSLTEILIIDNSGIVLSAVEHLADQKPGRDYAEKLETAVQDGLTVQSEPDAFFLSGPISINGHNWGTAALRFSLKPIQKEMQKLTIQSLATSFLFLIVGALLSMPLVGNIVGPIRSLAEYARKVGNGDLTEPPMIRSQDEVGQLGQAFAAMVEKLKLAMQDLEARMLELDRSREKLRNSERNYRELFENSLVGMFQCTGEGTLTCVNQAMAGMLGYSSPTDMRESRVSVLKLLNDSVEKALIVRNLQKDGRIEDVGAKVLTRDGRDIFVTLSARIVREEGGRPALIEGSVLDITARLERDRAEQERESARKANEMKSAFLANMSHEIRTPMNAVIGFAQMARKVSENEASREYLQKIHTSAVSLLGIINDILDFSRIEAGKMRIEKVAFHLDNVLGTTMDCVSLRALQKGLEVDLEVERDTPKHLIGDPMRLRQVLLNLTGNAVKFTEQGQVKLRVGTEGSGNGRADLYFVVQDTGIGLTEDQLDHLFSPFAQADASTTRKYGGSGLGLTICKSLVEQMGGQIKVKSQPGKGSRFFFVLPFDQATEEQSASSSQADFQENRDGLPASQTRICEDIEEKQDTENPLKDIQDVRDVIKALFNSLKSDMKAAFRQAKELRKQLEGTDLSRQAGAVQEDIYNFEIESALKRLEKLSRTIALVKSDGKLD